MLSTTGFLPVREFPDRGTQWLLDTPDNVRAIMRLLAPALAEQMDFTHLQRVRTTFIPDDLRKQMADLLFRVPFHVPGTDLELLIALLIENQASPDRTMGFRLLRYLVHYWEQEEREWESRKTSESLCLTPAVASVFYTGGESWARLPTLADLMNLPEVLREFVPDPRAMFLNLKAKPPEELTAWGDPLGWALRVLQQEHASEEQIAAVLREATTELATLADTDEAAWRRLMWYLLLLIYHRRAPAEREPLAGIVTSAARKWQREEEIAHMSNTIADELIREGEERATLRVSLRTRQEDVLRIMEVRFPYAPPTLRQQVRELTDLARLDDLLVRAATAARWEEVAVE
jgi:hypothetical protein